MIELVPSWPYEIVVRPMGKQRKPRNMVLRYVGENDGIGLTFSAGPKRQLIIIDRTDILSIHTALGQDIRLPRAHNTRSN